MSVSNYRSMSSRSVPIIVWVYAILFAVVVFSLFLLVLEKKPIPPSEAFHRYNAARLHALREAASGHRVRIVLLGDSRLRYSTHEDDLFAADVSRHLGKPVKSVRLVSNWAVFGDFEPLTTDILAAEPDLIVIQEEQLAKRRAQPISMLMAREYMRWRVAGVGPWNPGNLDQAALQHENRCGVLNQENAYERLERVSRWVDGDPTGNTAKRVLQFMDRAQKRGIATVLLTIPITTIGEEVLPSFKYESDRQTLAMDQVIPDTAFCDVVHMNETGRTIYSKWLAGSLADLLMNKKGDRDDQTV